MRISISTGVSFLFLITIMGFTYLPSPKSPSPHFNATGTISGTVTFDGKVPKLGEIKMNADPECMSKHAEKVFSEALVLGKNNTMANIFVRIKSGLAKKEYAPPKEPVVLDQHGCMYSPHVFGVMAGQTLKILNSDGILHNIHPLPKENRPFNLAMPKAIKVTEKVFKKVEEEKFTIKCDVHPWMHAYAAVMSNPFYAVTKEDGKFSIAGLDPGTYEIEAWHEKLGTLTAKVTVKAGETTTSNFTYKK
jgi:plastocyanin